MTVKFYYKNKLNDSTTFTFTSISSASSSYLYDRQRSSKAISVGSNDATNEDIVMDFGGSVTIDSILVDNHNIKSGSVQYWDGAAYTNFSTPATWSANVDTTSFFEFNSVSTSKIRLRATTTMVVNAQKYVGEIAVLESIGSPHADPASLTFTFSEDSRVHRLANGGTVYVLFGSKAAIELFFSDATVADIALFETLKYLGNPFYVYLCGGDQTLTDVGFRPRDLFLVNFIGEFSPKLKSNVLNMGQQLRMELAEA